MELFHPSRPLSLLLVDDTPLIRQAVRHLLEPLTTVRVAGEAADGESGVKMALAWQAGYCDHGRTDAGAEWHRCHSAD